MDLMHFRGGAQSNDFMKSIRHYNSLFAFTSLGVDVDRSINTGGGPYVFRINGVVHHRVGSLIPQSGLTPQYAQLYIYDTANEIQNRMSIFGQLEESGHHAESAVVSSLIAMFDACNPLVKQFSMARDRLLSPDHPNVGIRFVGSSDSHDNRYSLPTVPELAALIVGELTVDRCQYDIIVEENSGQLPHMSPLNPAHMSLQYPLLFPFGRKGFHHGIKYQCSEDVPLADRDDVTMLEYYCYECHYRKGEPNPFLCCGRLSNQLKVDCYSCVESSRLTFFYKNQDALRSNSYQGISDALGEGSSSLKNTGIKFLLPGTFTGGRRYMTLNYHDAMAICRHFGSPDIFTTFTCNPKWDEIIEGLKYDPGQKHSDRADLISRVFHMKLDEYIEDIKKGRAFGPVSAGMFLVCFFSTAAYIAFLFFFLH